MAQRLDMRFRNTGGRIVSIGVPDPLTTLTEEDVSNAMDLVLTQNIFTSSSGELVAKDSARIVNLTETVTEWEF